VTEAIAKEPGGIRWASYKRSIAAGDQSERSPQGRKYQRRAQDASASEHLAEGDETRHGCKPVWSEAANRPPIAPVAMHNAGVDKMSENSARRGLQ